MSIIGRFNVVRLLAKKLAKQVDIQKYQSSSISSHFQNLNHTEVSASLMSTGLHLGINLPDSILQEILDFAYSTRCYENLDPQLGFLYSERKEVNKKKTLFTA